MQISERGLTLIKEFESFCSTAYTCPAGVLTIGFGHTLGVKPGDRVTLKEANALLKSDLKSVESAIAKHVKVSLTQNQFDALCSLIFNIGVGAFSKSTLLKILNTGNYSKVPEQFMRWNKVNKKPVAGLTRRRAAEVDLWSVEDDVTEMPQAVDVPEKPLAQSRTIANASTAGVIGTAMIAAPVIEPAGEVVRIAQENPHGLLLVLGIALVVFAAIAIYLRIDDKRKGAA